MNNPEDYNGHSGSMEQISDNPKTLGDVYQKVAEILQQPERRGKPNVLLQFDGYVPDVSDLIRAIQEIYPFFSEAGGLHWSVPSDKPVNKDGVPQLFRHHPIRILPKDEGFVHVFLVFISKNGDKEEGQNMLFETEELGKLTC